MRRSIVAGLALCACSGTTTPPFDDRIGKKEFVSELCGRTLVAPAAIDTTFEVDCTGVDTVRSAGVTSGNTLIPVLGLAEPTALCLVYLKEPLRSPLQELRLDPVNVNADSGVATIAVTHGPSTWRTIDGCMRLDSYVPSGDREGGRGEGRYEVVVEEVPAGTVIASGRYALASGRVDWCQYGLRADCPAKFSTDLTKLVELDGPGGFVDFHEIASFRSVTAKATDCRILIDRGLGAVRVDLQVGVFKNLPVTQIGTSCFGGGIIRPPRPNAFVFEAGGVSGPGTFGPFPRCGDGAAHKPWFSWLAPRTWESASGEAVDCLLGYLDEQSETNPTEESECRFTIAENPGRFELDCTQSRWVVRGRSPGAAQTGDFHLRADCDLLYR